MKWNKNKVWLVGGAVALVSFVLLFAAVNLVLGNPVEPKTAAVFLVFSLIAGAIASAFCFWRARLGLILFLLGLCVGFFELYRMFSNRMDGWGDLAGLMSFFVWTGIGFAAGIAAEIVFLIYHRISVKR